MSNIQEPYQILLVVSDRYKDIANELILGATEVLDENNVQHATVMVPGALEIPAVIAQANRASSRPTGHSYDGYIALGFVIKGETDQHAHIANQSARVLMDMAVEGLAIGNGIICANNLEQAKIRASRNSENSGKDAAIACLRLIEVRKMLNMGGI